MREILFRGKRLDNGEWVASGNLLHADDNGKHSYYIPVYGNRFGTVEDEHDNILSIEYGTFYKVDPATVGQYTGLKDCNGKPVFEGDIVRLFSDVKRTFDISDGEVRWVRSAFVVGNGDSFRSSLSVVASYDWVLRGEIVGNIHDNPDLLEE